MSEWFKEHDWKSCDAGTYPEVQILFSAPEYKRTLAIFCQSLFCFLLLFICFYPQIFETTPWLKVFILKSLAPVYHPTFYKKIRIVFAQTRCSPFFIWRYVHIFIYYLLFFLYGLVVRLIGRLICLLVCWLADLWIGLLVCLLVDWLIGCFVCWLVY